jgi:hypothetical protein
LLLIQCGGQFDISPGKDFSVKLGGHDVQPFGVLPALQNGKMTGHAWTVRRVELGIASAELGAVVSPARDGADEKRVC